MHFAPLRSLLRPGKSWLLDCRAPTSKAKAPSPWPATLPRRRQRYGAFKRPAGLGSSSAPDLLACSHEWYQTDAEVVLSVFVRNVKPEDLKCEILPRSLSILYKLPTAGSEGAFDLDPLSHEVVPESSSFRALSSKIECGELFGI